MSTDPMPDRPSPSPPSGPAPHTRARFGTELRITVLWTLRLVVTLGLAAVFAWAAALVTAFGLGGVVLVLALVLLAIGSTIWRAGMLPLAVLAAALALPAAGIALGTTRFDRSIGTLIVRPDRPGALSQSTYRRGTGPILVDLRSMKAAPGSTTKISARADNGRIVVALPRDQCFNLDVRYSGYAAAQSNSREAVTDLASLVGLGNRWDNGFFYGSTGLGSAAMEHDTDVLNRKPWALQAETTSLLAYGRSPTAVGDYRRTVADPQAPRLSLRLRATDQIVVRDYPDTAGPLDTNGGDQVAGMFWPEGLHAPSSPGNQQYRLRKENRSRENRARWIKWEREIVRWGRQQAQRSAGACASRAELAQRAFTFNTQAEVVRNPSGRTDHALGGPTTRHSAIAQRAVSSARTSLVVEVNGLGQTKVVGHATAEGGYTAYAARTRMEVYR